MSRKIWNTPPFFFAVSSPIRVSSLPKAPRLLSHAVQVVVLLFPELAAPCHVALPYREVGHHIRQQAHGVRRRQYRNADELAERDDHEHGFELVAHFKGVAGELVARQPMHELGDHLAGTPEPRRPRSGHQRLRAEGARRSLGLRATTNGPI